MTERIVPIAMLAHVINLLDHHGTFSMAIIGNFAEMRNDVVVRVTVVTPCQNRRGFHRNRFDDDHAGTANGALQIVAMRPRKR